MVRRMDRIPKDSLLTNTDGASTKDIENNIEAGVIRSGRDVKTISEDKKILVSQEKGLDKLLSQRSLSTLTPTQTVLHKPADPTSFVEGKGNNTKSDQKQFDEMLKLAVSPLMKSICT